MGLRVNEKSALPGSRPAPLRLVFQMILWHPGEGQPLPLGISASPALFSASSPIPEDKVPFCFGI